MGNPVFISTTPLLVAFWGWILLLAYWTIASLFVHRTKSTEPILRRMQHQIPFGLAFYLILDRDRYFFLYGPVYQTGWNNWIVYPGLLMTAAGFAIAVWARIHLGRYWSGIITLKEGHKVIDRGPYRFVRHPIYTGWLLAALGTAFFAGTADGFAGVELLLFAFVLKLQREERLLTAELGDEYRRYVERVPCAILPWISASRSNAGLTIESEAFNQAALRSDRYRAIALLCICGVFAVFDSITALTSSGPASALYGHAVALAFCLATYEGILLALTAQAQWQGKHVRPWVWTANTVIESLLPTLGLLGLTADASYVGPYRALVSSPVMLYCLFIILSTLRLRPALCILSGLSSAIGYLGVFVFTLHVAPHNPSRHFMPDRMYFNFAFMLVMAGLIAAAVARQIRTHLIAALQEAETRRKLDRIEFDLKTARTIQMGLLPKSAPIVAAYDIAGWSEPADQTGGDYYDWIELPDGRIIVTIADATGHGIGPALLIAACRAYFRAIATRNDPLECIMAQVDALLGADVSDGRFITAAIALLDSREDRLSLYSAGHAPMYLYVAADDRVMMYNADQPPLGTQFGANDTHARTFSLAPGDSLVLVTDGFFECANKSGQMLGMDPLGEAIRNHHALGAENLIRRLYEDVLEFSQGAPQADDITAVVIKRNAV
jgi:serine phosphatase RsbU (regulator of sigma subunit)/protein-S-isoprenylcysteine O-methyltransferase Ste14